MNVQIPQDQLGAMVGAAVLQSITADQRATLIQEAIVSLLKPSDRGGYYGDRRTPLQEAFDAAVRDLARQEVSKMLESDGELRARIAKCYEDAVSKAFVDKREEMVSKIAEAIVQGMRFDR